jgi:hypothetical protein
MMNREFVAITVNERESRLWKVWLDKYLRPHTVEAFPDDTHVIPRRHPAITSSDDYEAIVTRYVGDDREIVVVGMPQVFPTSTEVLVRLQRLYMYDSRRSA